MGFYEAGLQKVVRGAMRIAEHRIGKVAELGTPLPRPVEGANPVLLVHGFGNDSSAMAAVGRSLTRDGFDVHTIDLPNHGMGDAYADADLVGAKIAEIRAATGAEVVDVVGHSRGGIVARTWQQLKDETGVTGRVVTVSSANRGVHMGPMDRLVGGTLPEGMKQIRRGSELITELDRTVAPYDVANVGTTGIDGVLVPADTTRLAGKPWFPVDDGRTIGPMSRVGHWEMLRDDTAYEAIRGALMLPRTPAAGAASGAQATSSFSLRNAIAAASASE